MNIIILALIAGIVIISVFLAGIWFSAKTRRKITYMLDALEDNETNFRFREKGIMERGLNKNLNRMKRIFEKEKARLAEQEVYFGKMLDSVTTGIIAVEEGGSVTYSNNAARQILGVYTLSNIKQLSRISPELSESLMKVTEGDEKKATFINNMSQITVSLKASSADFNKKGMKIISINDISGETEEIEAASWNKLIRVLTHEIMNTITPISSLSESLAGLTGPSSTPELKEGLETISSSSKGLIRFVESYRSLTRIPAPVKKVLYLKDVMNRAITLVESNLDSSGVKCSYEEKSDEIIIYADESQILQIVINLIRNGVQAGATLIRITARVNAAENVIIDVANNGTPISRESMGEIFVPFFTTKQSGSGIGLSLSRQIMRMHNGNLLLSKSDETETIFTMIFR